MNVEKIFNKKIVLENVSAIIIKGEKGYTDITTGKTADTIEETVPVDKRYMFYVDLFNGNNKKNGFYAHFDEKNNCLFLLQMILDLNFKWQEVGRLMFYYDNGLKYKGEIIMAESACDICGQSSGRLTDAIRQIMPGESWKQAFLFFKSFPLIVYRNCDNNHNDNNCLISTCSINSMKSFAEIRDLLDDKQKYATFRGELALDSINSDGKIIRRNEDDFPVLPEKALHNVVQFFESKEREERKSCYHISRIPYASCLQKVGNDVYRRCFKYAAFAGRTIKDTEFVIVEFKRDKLRPIESAEDAAKERINRNSFPVWTDDLSGTFLEHTSRLLYKWINIYEKELENYEKNRNKTNSTQPFYRLATNEFSQYFNTNIPCIIYIIENLASSPDLEKLYNLEYEGIENVRYSIETCLSFEYYYEDYLCRFGQIWNPEKETFHGRMGVPAAMLKTALKYNDAAIFEMIICTAKEIFEDSEESRKYLKRLNETDCDFFASWTTMVHEYYLMEESLSVIKKLMFIYGYKNWRNYASFILTNLKEDLLIRYDDYLNKLLVIGELAKKMEWRLSGDNLKKADASLKETYQISSDAAIKAQEDFKMEKHFEKWGKYCYEDENFLITFPKTTEDIIKEGIILHHCVKDFILFVTNGQTNILFIRKKEEPDKPFFTLEIRSGSIRQCHGFANKNIDREDGLEEFLKKFCEAKKIVFNKGDRQLAV